MKLYFKFGTKYIIDYWWNIKAPSDLTQEMAALIVESTKITGHYYWQFLREDLKFKEI